MAIADGSFFWLALLALIMSFVGGVLVGLAAGLKRVRGATQAKQVPMRAPVSFAEDRIDIKLCSECQSTYTDEELNYCLRDGTQLKVVGSMPRPGDPEATKVINPRRTS